MYLFDFYFQVNQPYAFISSTLTFWAPVIVMLVMYRRIYKEALRQKEAIRRSSVPSQQHLIVDSDSVRSRFQALQANGFRSSTTKATPPIPTLPTPPSKAPPPPLTKCKQNHSPAADEITATKAECETKFNGDKSPSNCEPTVAPPQIEEDDTPSEKGSGKNASNNTHASITNSPVRNTLTPTNTLLGTMQRRLSFANTNLSEGKTLKHICSFYYSNFGTLFAKQHNVRLVFD